MLLMKLSLTEGALANGGRGGTGKEKTAHQGSEGNPVCNIVSMIRTGCNF